jgi:hypothetical protein
MHMADLAATRAPAWALALLLHRVRPNCFLPSGCQAYHPPELAPRQHGNPGCITALQQGYFGRIPTRRSYPAGLRIGTVCCLVRFQAIVY